MFTKIAALLAAGVGLILISGIPALKNADHGWKWVLGGIGWFGGLAIVLVAVVAAVATLVRRRRPAAV